MRIKTILPPQKKNTEINLHPEASPKVTKDQSLQIVGQNHMFQTLIKCISKNQDLKTLGKVHLQYALIEVVTKVNPLKARWQVAEVMFVNGSCDGSYTFQWKLFNVSATAMSHDPNPSFLQGSWNVNASQSASTQYTLPRGKTVGFRLMGKR